MDKLSIEAVANRIVAIRGKKVMLDRDLAELYAVPVKVLNQAVKRNIKRFPSDFMFQLSYQEATNLKSQFVTSSWGGTRKLPSAFTEQGVSMLSSVLNSERSIEVNIAIMRAFVKLRELLLTHKELAEKIDELERKYADHDQKFLLVFEAIRQLLKAPEPPPPPQAQEKPQIGFGK